MKKIRENICYVETEDLLRFPTPNFINLSTELQSNKIVMFEETKAVEYFKNRQDIVDYDLVSELSQEDLDRMIIETKEKLLHLSDKWLNSFKQDRNKFYKDEEYQNNLKTFKAIYECLTNYNFNKEKIDIKMKYIELKSACQKYPRIQLSTNEHEHYIFDSEYIDCAEDGFIEIFCLSKEEREKVKKMRKLTKSLNN